VLSYRPTKQQPSANYDPADLRRFIVSQPDERLLDIVTHERAQYVPATLNLAEAELRRRGLSYTGSPPAAPKPVSARSRNATIIRRVFWATCGLVILMIIFNTSATWVFPTYRWLFRMVAGCGVALVVLSVMFDWAGQLLGWLRRVRLP
jgi:hypothetical protein